MNKRQLIATTVFLLLPFFQSCGVEVPPPCGPFKNENVPYDIVDVRLEVMEAPFDLNSDWVEHSYYPLSDMLDVSPSRLLLNLEVADLRYAGKKQGLEKLRFRLIRTAYACSPPPRFTNDKIVSLNIRSNSDYSSSLLAGSSLNNIFQIVYTDSDVNGEKYKNKTLSEFIAQSPTAGENLQFILLEPPSLGNIHNFTVEYLLDDGDYFELTTGNIQFIQM
ncbi:MAG: hypothetical protein OEZ47_17075 [Gammaproteobacteria bacterium]|nr:hypothetical protein [Gammaproteobacteria bacterium]